MKTKTGKTGIYAQNPGSQDDNSTESHCTRIASAVEILFEQKKLTLYETMDLQMKLMQVEIEHGKLNELINIGTMLEAIANKH